MVQDRDGLVILCMAHCFFGTTSHLMCCFLLFSFFGSKLCALTSFLFFSFFGSGLCNAVLNLLSTL